MRVGWRPLVGLFALLGAACTGGGSGAISPSTLPPTTTTTTTLPVDAAAAAYVECLNDNGVEIDPIRIDAAGRPHLDQVNDQLDYSDPATIVAISACAGFMGNGALDLAGNAALREGVMDQLNAFSRCLRARGVTEFPDPIPGFIGVGSPYPAAEIPYSDPDLPAAALACQETVFGDFPGAGG